MDSVSAVTSSQASMSARRRVLYSLVASTCLEAGYTSADNYALDVLLQLFQGFLTEISHSAKQFCEHAGRTEPLPGDVIMALIEMGFDLKALPAYAFRSNRVIVPSPSQMPKQMMPKILQTGKSRPLHHYIPDCFPPFPDSHSYISTPTFKQPITEYETLREKSSTHKRDVERALTRFMARTFTSSISYSLFPEEQMSHLFPLIGIKTDHVPYLSALLPKDQIWEEDEGSSSSIYKDESKAKDKLLNENSQLAELDTGKDEEDNMVSNEVEMVDNPYLRPAKIVNDTHFDF